MSNELNKKHVFVCGLQRSGTSVLARNIGRLEDCTGFKNTGVLQDEGQYLQDVYPVDVEFGGTGRYGFHPRAHLTEISHMLTPENVARLRASWHSHWDEGKAIRLEKTPSNLIMTRFLQAAFPNAYFIVIRRHPVPVSLATQKWSLSSLHSLLEHWLRCHELFDEDKKHLKHVYELTYEDYIAEPGRYHREIATFIGTRPPEREMERLTSAHNKKYLDRWSELLERSPFRSYYRHVAGKYEPRFAKYGYSLISSSIASREQLASSTKRSAIGALYQFGADAAALVSRLHGRRMDYLSKRLRSRLPDSLKNKIKHALKKNSLRWVARLLLPRWFADVQTKVSVLSRFRASSKP